MNKKEKIISYKGFNSDMSCRGFEFKVGKTYKQDGEIKACKNGFHACPMPLSVFDHYAPANNQFAIVEQSGDIDKESDKIASSKIKIKAKITLFDLVKAQIEWVHSHLDPTKANSVDGYQGAATQTGDRGAATQTGDQGAAIQTGDQGAATQTGYQGAAIQTGDQGAATQTGYRGAANVTGKYSVALANGIQGRVSAKKDGFIVLIDWQKVKNEWIAENIYSAKVGGIILNKKIKSGYWYWFVNGELQESKVLPNE
jgi:hypothetical protein